ncbi:helix-turn-helix transcriptional regulator [Enterocloster clostridioformis]|uniref:helix-turn-helix transcriptional regulator n=1 Tax=Enterocloster clostridioformis TaxID=1531 RepID=UPI000DDAA7A8|nr:helix-turn-helix transcriptional regulator [Enterocloster clostridioformis]MCA5577126.1 helix-turn-helix domain-containing protein [Enterocloster clostridioformis]
MRVRQLRQGKELTQWELADKLKISLRTYQRIEYGQQKPSYKVILELQKIFQENIEFILQEI